MNVRVRACVRARGYACVGTCVCARVWVHAWVYMCGCTCVGAHVWVRVCGDRGRHVLLGGTQGPRLGVRRERFAKGASAKRPNAKWVKSLPRRLRLHSP